MGGMQHPSGRLLEELISTELKLPTWLDIAAVRQATPIDYRPSTITALHEAMTCQHGIRCHHQKL